MNEKCCMEYEKCKQRLQQDYPCHSCTQFLNTFRSYRFDSINFCGGRLSSLPNWPLLSVKRAVGVDLEILSYDKCKLDFCDIVRCFHELSVLLSFLRSDLMLQYKRYSRSGKWRNFCSYVWLYWKELLFLHWWIGNNNSFSLCFFT